MTTHTLVQGGEAGRWEQAIYAFLAEKERRSGSMRTVRAYSGMLYCFFGILGKPPDEVTATEVFGYAHGTGISGKKPSSVTIGPRIATERPLQPRRSLSRGRSPFPRLRSRVGVNLRRATSYSQFPNIAQELEAQLRKHRWPPVSPGLRCFKCCGRPQHHRVIQVSANDLKSYREAILGPAGGN